MSYSDRESKLELLGRTQRDQINSLTEAIKPCVALLQRSVELARLRSLTADELVPAMAIGESNLGAQIAELQSSVHLADDLWWLQRRPVDAADFDAIQPLSHLPPEECQRDIQYKLLNWAQESLQAIQRSLKELKYKYLPVTSHDLPHLFRADEKVFRDFSAKLKSVAAKVAVPLHSAKATASLYVKAFGTTRKVGGRRSQS